MKVFTISLVAVAITGYCNAFDAKHFSFLRKCVASTGLAISTFSIGYAPEIAKADAISAAINAMNTKSSEGPAVERALDDLPVAAKKRRAISLCKESRNRNAAGFSSASECNSAVLAGNYERILSSSPSDIPTSPRVASGANQISPSSSTRSSSTSITESRPRTKVTDLSDLSSAAKKRRALAACKRPEARKDARMGSESKCTERVMSGDVDALIESMEASVQKKRIFKKADHLNLSQNTESSRL
eukprot:gene3041-5958_t